jgi:RNA polymerase sigma-70 factor (ECF subfamily)
LDSELVRGVAGLSVGDYADLQDNELLGALQAGDLHAFEELFRRYSHLVYSTCVRVLEDAQAAEDMTQEVFLRLWRRPELYDPERGRFLSWLLSVTRNRAIDELRSRGRRRAHETQSEMENDSDEPTASDDPLMAAELADQRMALRSALAELPEEQRKAIELAYFGGLTHLEISVLLRQPLGTVKTRIRLGMRKLRVALQRKVETGEQL